MSDSEQMPKVNTSKGKISGLNQAQYDFMKLIEKENAERVLKLQKVRRNNVITGSVIGCGVLGIYLYSIFAVKQERFLDDFNEPEKVLSKQL